MRVNLDDNVILLMNMKVVIIYENCRFESIMVLLQAVFKIMKNKFLLYKTEES